MPFGKCEALPVRIIRVEKILDEAGTKTVKSFQH